MNVHTLTRDSLAHRVCMYFLANQEEQLSDRDIAAKYDVARASVQPLLNTAVAAQFLAVSRGTYSAGAKLGQALTGLPTQPPAPPKAKPERKLAGWATKGLSIDVTAIPIRTDIPLPVATGRSVRGDNKWSPLFDRLTTPGMCAPLPVVWKSAITKATTVYQNKTRKRFAVRMIDAQTVGVFRLEGEFTPVARKGTTPQAGA